MIITTNNKKYSVIFKHKKVITNKPYFHKDISLLLSVGEWHTYCRVKDITKGKKTEKDGSITDLGKIIVEEECVCHSIDTYDKHIGKSISFKKALDYMSRNHLLDHVERSAFKNEFINQFGVPVYETSENSQENNKTGIREFLTYVIDSVADRVY